jgi:hypothetical protein
MKFSKFLKLKQYRYKTQLWFNISNKKTNIHMTKNKVIPLNIDFRKFLT